MLYIILALFAMAGIAAVGKVLPDHVYNRQGRDGLESSTTSFKLHRILARAGLGVIVLFLLAATSFVYVGKNEVGVLAKTYGTGNLMEGRIVATEGEKGYQAATIAPGFHVIPLVSVIYEFKTYPVVEVPAGFYGQIEALDGAPLPLGEVMAPEWEEDERAQMLNATYFLRNGGQKGLQVSVLTPGKYRLNPYLFRVKIGNGASVQNFSSVNQGTRYEGSLDTRVTQVPAGHVAVVRSNVSQIGAVCTPRISSVSNIEGSVSAPLVNRGCKGIWRESLGMGAYFLNRKAYEAILVDTRVQRWSYTGGYTKRFIDLKINDDGQIEQTVRSEKVLTTADDADKAVFVKVEGWEIPQELRVVVQITPENAPIIVAAVGSVAEVEDKILTPAIRSIVRNVIGGTITIPNSEGGFLTRETRALDLMEYRDILENTVETLIQIEGRKSGVEIKEVRFGEPAIPPELLVARKREQIAEQLRSATIKEREFQRERVATEKQKATANQQGELVKADIARQAAVFEAAALKLQGEGERDRLTAIASGQKAQVTVLGEDRVMQLQMIGMVLGAFQENPELVGMIEKFVPNTMVIGAGVGLEGPAAILGGLLGGNKSTDK